MTLIHWRSWRDEMEYYLETTKSIKEMKKCIYNCPLPRKKQRTQARGRSGKVVIFDQEQIDQYLNNLGEEVLNVRRTAKN
jgi:hypothetical protein